MNIIYDINQELADMSVSVYDRIKSKLPIERHHGPSYTLTENELVYRTEVCGETVSVYTRAIQDALDNHASVYIPFFEHPLYLDGTILLNSGNSLQVHPDTRLVLLGDTCMLRNRNVMSGIAGVLWPGINSDSDISVSGGIWSCPESIRLNDFPYRDFPGCDASFVLHNVTNVRIENMRIQDINRMGMQIGNCEGFVVQGIRFENATRDGIHVEGPAAYGLIRDISGRLGDDHVALNSWDWGNSSLTFGPIRDIIVEDISCDPGYLWSEMRLHPGVKAFPGGQFIECPIYNICMRNIHGVHTIKLYHQPNLMAPGRDLSPCLGNMYNLFFENMTFDYFPASDYYVRKQAAFEVHADVYNLYLKDIHFTYPLRDEKYSSYAAVGIGPMSATWKNGEDPSDWIEFFAADKICRVNRVVMENITVQGEHLIDAGKLVEVRRESKNPDYPRTTPAGGIGFGILGELYIR